MREPTSKLRIPPRRVMASERVAVPQHVPAPRRRRRVRWAIAGLVGVVAASAVFAVIFRVRSGDERSSAGARPDEPLPAALTDPPAVDLTGVDPAVANVIGAAREAVRTSPRSAAAWGRLGMVLLAHELPSEANAAFEQAERLDRRDPRWPYYQASCLTSGKPQAAMAKLWQAVKLMQSAAGITPQAAADARVRLGELLLSHGRPQEAQAQFESVLKRDPGNPWAELGLARAAWAQERADDAAAHLGRCAGDARTVRASNLLLAQVRRREGSERGAREALARAAAAPPDEAWPDPFGNDVAALKVGRQARLERADALLSGQRVAEAVDVLREAVREYPDSDWAWFLLGRALLMRQDLTGAQRALARAAALAPDAVGAQFHLGILYLVRKDYARAASHLAKAAEVQPDFAPAHYSLGRCRRALADAAGAAEAFRTALRYQPTYADAHVELAEVLAESGGTKEAVKHLRAAVELAPENRRAVTLLRRIQERSGAE